MKIAQGKDKHNLVTLLLLAVLLFLRLVLFGGVKYFTGDLPPAWLRPVFEVGTFFFTAVFLWWERDRLAEYHVDRLALIIILVFKPIETIVSAVWGITNTGLSFPQLPGLLLWGIALGLFVALRASHVQLPKVRSAHIAWFLAGILGGSVAMILLAYPMSLTIPGALVFLPDPLARFGPDVLSFPYQLGYSAVTEEPLFRGFLWGCLRRSGWKEVWIWLAQAVLFMLGHIYYLQQAPIAFWVIVPAGALVLGLLAWRSRSIATSMAAHATMNTIGHFTGYIIAYLRYR